jgi:hypothetical protein
MNIEGFTVNLGLDHQITIRNSELCCYLEIFEAWKMLMDDGDNTMLTTCRGEMSVGANITDKTLVGKMTGEMETKGFKLMLCRKLTFLKTNELVMD